MLANEPNAKFGAGWDFFDAIYCISLDSRADRLAAAREQFAAVGLDRVEYVIVRKDQEDRARGIFQSHMQCLAKGLAAGARWILVFEDDILFRRFDHGRLREACVFLREQRRWDGLFLGCITSGAAATTCSAVSKVRYRCLAHAYVLHRPFAERIVREQWRGIAYDELLRRHGGEFFAISPMCAHQGLAGSDNQTVLIDRIRNLFGGLPLIQRGNELFQHHKAAFVALHLLVIIAFALLILYLRS